MNKCERKDGKLSKCHTYAKVCCLSGNQAPDGYITLWGEKLDFCPFCGADIRKPEEKPLPVKSEETTCTGAILGHCDYVYIKENGFGCNYNYICAFQRPQKLTAHELQGDK